MLSKRIIGKALEVGGYLMLPSAAREECRRDWSRGLGEDPGIERPVAECINWLARAQDCSTSKDGGVACYYSLLSGWGASYPETTGYIIPTMIAVGAQRQDGALLQRARKMLDWLVKIQFPEGGFQGSEIGKTPVVPVTFNTGQILLGLASGAAAFGRPYLDAMHKAAEWLVTSQDPDGCWRKHPTPFVAASGEKAYETHVAWGLLEAATVGREQQYADAALRNVHWALTKQRKQGWFADCCLSDPSQPLTHTLGYVLRGVLEAYRYTKDSSLLESSRRTAEGLLSALTPQGFLPGRLDPQWKGTVSWACLTGSLQIAHCWLLLYQQTRDPRFRDGAFLANQYVRRTIRLDGPLETRGAIKGSFPITGDYGRFQYLNWAAKFFIDSNLLEQSIRTSEECDPA
jgi:Prenyltransferase and squalene oxidase repeat